MSMRSSFPSLFIIFLSCSALTAQTNVSVNKGDFKLANPGFKSAWEHIKAGDSFYSRGNSGYSKAFEEYLQANRYNSENPELNYRLGVASLFSDNKEKAYEYFLKAMNLKNDVAEDILVLTGMALQYASRYEEAAGKFKDFMALETKKNEKLLATAGKKIKECLAAAEIVKDTLNVEIVNAGNEINSETDDYAAVISSDGTKMYFASGRKTAANANSAGEKDVYDENILYSVLNEGNWTLPVPAGKNLATPYNETPLFLDRTDNVLYVYIGYEGDGDIKYSEFLKGEWKSLRSEPFGVNSLSPETSFCISPSGMEIAFVSDRGKAGHGGKDIYLMRLNGKKWTSPVNAGEAVNSEYNEESVRFSPGSDTLWFSSTGHNTMGGFDIFYCTRNENGEWSKAVNAGYPLNSPWNELFYMPSPADKNSFYFVSNRPGGLGGLDIYTGRFLPSAR